MNNNYPVAVIGAGPVGLAAAAHLVERGETPLVLEAASGVGENIRTWGHVPTFSPWKYNVDTASVALLEKAGWQMPPAESLPTGQELIDLYLAPLAQTPELAPHIHLNTRVTGVSRRRTDKMKDAQRDDTPFVIYADVNGEPQRFLARAVIDASGTWATPNPIGSDGMPAPGEAKHADRIFYGIPDVLGEHSHRYANKTVAVIGGGHSSINAILELGDLQKEHPATKIVWVMRKPTVADAYGGLEGDALPGRGLLGIRIKEMVEADVIEVVTPFFLLRVEGDESGLQLTGEMPAGESTIRVDEVIAATGARPDLSFIQELRVSLDPSVESTPALAPLIDPNIHSCGSVRPHGEAELRHPEKDFYIVGMKSYGRAPTFLMATGYEQVRSVVAGLVGDWEAAAAVELCLPETGVCGGVGSAASLLESVDCCAVPVAATEDAVNGAATNANGSCCGTVDEVLTLVGNASNGAAVATLGIQEALSSCCGPSAESQAAVAEAAIPASCCGSSTESQAAVAETATTSSCCGTVEEVVTMLDGVQSPANDTIKEKLANCCSD